MKKLLTTIIFVSTFLASATLSHAKPLITKTGETLLFDFGEKKEEAWIKADSSTKYTSDNGYGWSMTSFLENKPLSGNSVLSDAVSIKRDCENKTEFKIDVTPGIYDISVYSGDIRFMSIGFEGYEAITNLEYAASETRVQIPVKDKQLNMTLMRGSSGTDLSVAAMTLTKVSDLDERKKRIFVCGDSTAATFYPLFMYQPLEDGYRGGWGQMLAAFLSDNVYVHNMSAQGQSAKSFIDSDRLKSTLFFIEEGDYAFISFGINDMNAYSKEEYCDYMSQIIEDVKSRGGIPVIISSPPYLHDFSSDGAYNGADRCYSDAGKELAKKHGLIHIDLNALSSEFYSEAGSTQLKRMYWTTWNGTKDNIHLSRNGAGQLARLIAEECSRKGLDFVADKTVESLKADSDIIRVKSLKNNVYVQNVFPNEQSITIVTNTYKSGKLTQSKSLPVTLPAFDVLSPYNTTELSVPLYDRGKHIFLMSESYCTPLEWITE